MVDLSSAKKNIFPGAHDAVWGAFPWHDGAASPHSSQALAVSVFGTLAVHPARQVLIDAMLHSAFGWESAGDDAWRVDLERTLGRSLLGERRSATQVDVLLHNKTSVVMLECKFTEAGGGPCSQPQPLSSGPHQGLIQCNGDYQEQTNPVNGTTARCALTAKGIRYWEHIPTYFDLNADNDYEPCPFAGPTYQYMRNLLAAGEWARRHKKIRAAFGLVYLAGKGFPVSAEVADPGANGTNSSRACAPTRRWRSRRFLTRISCKYGTNACQGMRCWLILPFGLRGKSKALPKQSEDVLEEALNDPIKSNPDNRISRLDPG